MKHYGTLLFVSGLLLFGIAIYDMIIWFQISADHSKTFRQAVEEYNKFIPAFAGRHTMALLNIVLLSLATLCFFNARRRVTSIRAVCNILSVISLILIGWMLFSMM